MGGSALRAVVQRVKRSHVDVAGQTVGEIERGLMVLLGVSEGDQATDAQYLANKIAGLRIFDDADGKMNLNVSDVSGEILVISQFTLLGDARRGNRPSFIGAASPSVAQELYQQFCSQLMQRGIVVATGIFQADMQVHLINDGPVTILLDSRKSF
jgi:D-tyrosyl-tRNA(Tyr) deacylase